LSAGPATVAPSSVWAANSPRHRIATTVVVGVAAMATILLVQTVLGWLGHA
jgi:hypothetical protein